MFFCLPRVSVMIQEGAENNTSITFLICVC